MAGRSTPLITSVAVSALSPDLRLQLDSTGLIGPFVLSASSTADLQHLIDAAAEDENPRNLHARLPLAMQIITDPSITRLVVDLFGPDICCGELISFRASQEHPTLGLVCIMISIFKVAIHWSTLRSLVTTFLW